MAVGQLEARTGITAWRDQELGPRKPEDIVIGISMFDPVGDLAGRAAIADVARKPDCDIAVYRPGRDCRKLARAVIPGDRPHSIFRLECRIVAIDEYRAGDRILPLGRRLGTSEYFDPLQVPGRLGA